MNEKNQNPLNDLLRQWARQGQPDAAEVQRLRGRIAKAVQETEFLDVPPAPSERRWQARRGRGVRFVLGAAAAAALVLLLWPAGERPRPIAVQHESQDLPSVVRFEASQLTQKSRLLAGMEEMFNGRLAWLAEHGRQVELGILPDSVSSSRDAKPLVVRVVVLARKSGESGWKPIWQTDVIAREEEVVELAAQDGRNGRLRLWMHPLPDGAVAVEGDLALGGTIPVRSSLSGIQSAGVPQRVFTSQTEDVEYHVYQTVSMLAGKENS